MALRPRLRPGALHPGDIVPVRNILSLCAGVGGLELGILLALHHRGEAGRGICYVERECAAAASLVASMDAGWLHPAPVWSDMLTFDARPWRGAVHILASGDPCQDNSVAGKRAGASGQRFLAPQVCRVAAECRPDLIFRENVPGNLAEQLAALAPPLEGLGYRVAAGIFSSAETGNTMRRERGFVLAELVRNGRERGEECDLKPDQSGQQAPCRSDAERRDQGLGSASGPGRFPGAHPGLRRGEEGRGPRDAQPQRRGGAVAGALRPELAGQQRGQHHPAGRQVKNGPAPLPGRAGLPPAVIPGPTDSRWIDVLDRWPELQPALSAEEAQSHLRRGIDALAHRIERLRATGNGVDPVVAAYAFLSLRALLDGAPTPPAEDVLTWPA